MMLSTKSIASENGTLKNLIKLISQIEFVTSSETAAYEIADVLKGINSSDLKSFFEDTLPHAIKNIKDIIRSKKTAIYAQRSLEFLVFSYEKAKTRMTSDSKIKELVRTRYGVNYDDYTDLGDHNSYADEHADEEVLRFAGSSANNTSSYLGRTVIVNHDFKRIVGSAVEEIARRNRRALKDD